jgi:hypothetical protein
MITFTQLMESLGGIDNDDSLNEAIVKVPLSRYRIAKGKNKRRFKYTSSRPGYRIKIDPKTKRPKEVAIPSAMKRRFKLASLKRKRNPANKRKQKLGRLRAKRVNRKLKLK